MTNHQPHRMLLVGKEWDHPSWIPGGWCTLNLLRATSQKSNFCTYKTQKWTEGKISQSWIWRCFSPTICDLIFQCFGSITSSRFTHAGFSQHLLPQEPRWCFRHDMCCPTNKILEEQKQVESSSIETGHRNIFFEKTSKYENLGDSTNCNMFSFQTWSLQNLLSSLKCINL